MTEESSAPKKKRFGCLHVLGIVLVAVLISILATGWWVKHNIYASTFANTTLSESEEVAFSDKLARLEAASGSGAPVATDNRGPATEAYSEEGANREIRITERELNAVIDKNPEWADKVSVDLSNDLLSIVLLLPLDEECPWHQYRRYPAAVRLDGRPEE